ncbi:MAG: hypothetical protein ACYC4U_05055 [Pirellulaceae bacterium]
MTRHALVLLLFALLFTDTALSGEGSPQPETLRALPGMQLYNPTDWDGPLVVKVPVGHLASPDLVDWSSVRLEAEDGREVAFAICEGRPHWKAALRAPLEEPRAEDVLVFTAVVDPNTWARYRFLPGMAADFDGASALNERDGQLVVTYQELEVIISPETGMLQQVRVHGEPLLTVPLAVTFAKLTTTESEAEPLAAPRVTLAGKSSNKALTVLHFVLAVDERLSMAVSYYVYAAGSVEIWVDERPWQPPSPWADRVATIDWSIGGTPEPLPYLVNRAPFYGFKDFAAVLHHAATVHRLGHTAVVEFGEETTNGRRWMRRLLCVPPDRVDRISALIEAADKGLIVETEPMEILVPGAEVTITHPPEEHLAARRMGAALQSQGRGVKIAVVDGSAADAAQAAIQFQLVGATEVPEIEGDGFQILPADHDKGVTVTARTRFGLLQAVRRMTEHLAKRSDSARLPLLASNPVVALRSGGFGGGDFEVDFPHGSEAEWDEALEGLAGSGMNVMADLGMWSNWKMPVSYHYMPELRSGSADAYDEVSGAKFSELDLHRERGLRRLQFLHDRGVKVWLWLPVGCVPTTYAQQHPEAMAPDKPNCPCFTHPLYNRYLESFLTELLETYAIDGIVMIRDDNGGLCPCQRCHEYVERSQTKSAAWEQYLILYRWLRSKEFRGDVAVYPYWDYYEPRLDPVLPADLLVVGHGSGATVLARDYERSAPMGDTWLDNVFANFRVASTARMRRLLADRNAFWIGGALRGSELPWQSIGRFGWEPTATVNTFRFEWAARQFGREGALPAVGLIDTYEKLWEIYDLPLLPQEWMKLNAEQRVDTSAWGRQLIEEFGERLGILRAGVDEARHDAWLQHVELFGVYFEYQLQRLELFTRMHALAAENKSAVEQGGQLAEPQREELLAAHRAIYALAEQYDRQVAGVPGNMLVRTRALKLTQPFKEFVGGFDPSLDGVLQVRQFVGAISVVPDALAAGQPFVLRIGLRNTGVCPWMEEVGHAVELQGDIAGLGLPARWDFVGPPLVLGDQREIELRGIAPVDPGEATIHVRFTAPFRHPHAIVETDVTLRWN